MLSIFRKAENLPIDSGGPNTVVSHINVEDIEGNVEQLTVTVDIQHTYTSDLKITLRSPDGRQVVLVNRAGRNRDNFSHTTFDDRSATPIRFGLPPFRGRFQPEEPLSNFNGVSPNGEWELKIDDQASLDGGMLNSWQLAITSRKQSNFNIEVRFRGSGLSSSQQDVFQAAADRWSEIIVGDIPEVQTAEGLVDDVVIDASATEIDGAGGTLGRAGPTVVRVPSFIPARGIMEFDSDDLRRMEQEGSLVDVIIHEMGHVLGIGTIWSNLGLVQGLGTFNPVFIGQNAMREFGRLMRTNSLEPVPVANRGGPGTAGGHWRESVFGNELLSGFLNSGINPISRMSIAAMSDMGYEVELGAADSYQLPSQRELAIMGLTAPHSCRCKVERPDFSCVPCDSGSH